MYGFHTPQDLDSINVNGQESGRQVTELRRGALRVVIFA